jgi:hypothetical protein
MRAVEISTERLVLKGSAPIFRPFFLGGLGWMVLGSGILLGARAMGMPLGGPWPGDESSTPIAGLAAFLVPFGFFIAFVPFIGAVPYRKDVVVDRATGQLRRRDRSLRASREHVYALGEIRGVDVEESKHVDGDPYYTALLRLESGESVALDRFVDRGAAEHVAQLVRYYLIPP